MEFQYQYDKACHDTLTAPLGTCDEVPTLTIALYSGCGVVHGARGHSLISREQKSSASTLSIVISFTITNSKHTSTNTIVVSSINSNQTWCCVRQRGLCVVSLRLCVDQWSSSYLMFIQKLLLVFYLAILFPNGTLWICSLMKQWYGKKTSDRELEQLVIVGFLTDRLPDCFS